MIHTLEDKLHLSESRLFILMVIDVSLVVHCVSNGDQELVAFADVHSVAIVFIPEELNFRPWHGTAGTPEFKMCHDFSISKRSSPQLTNTHYHHPVGSPRDWLVTSEWLCSWWWFISSRCSSDDSLDIWLSVEEYDSNWIHSIHMNHFVKVMDFLKFSVEIMKKAYKNVASLKTCIHRQQIRNRRTEAVRAKEEVQS